MYKKILVALDHTDTDKVLLLHVSQLADITHSELLLVHVADGWAARHYERFHLAESEEMKKDRVYLEKTKNRLLEKHSITITAQLALGDPPQEILRLAEKEHCDLIAMTTHGHRLIGDFLFGSTIDYVRHRTQIPLLIVSALDKKKDIL
jgi:nucleotide-binding universal stress UspA family protein